MPPRLPAKVSRVKSGEKRGRKQSRRLLALPATLLGASALALTLAACGGVSQEDFAAEANEICVGFSKWSDGRERSFRAALESGDSAAAAAVLIEYERRFERVLREIDSLEAPDGDADREAIDRFLTVGRQQAALLPDLASAIEAGDLEELETLSAEGEQLEVRLGRVARDYGLDDCAGAPARA